VVEASALTHASRRGLLARRSPLLKLERDERLVALIRSGHDRAFEVLFDRYHARLLAFCGSMLKSRQDAEDVLQEVFTKAHAAMLADDRPLKVRPWLYRIARNRCLNHLRRPVPQGQDSMDIHPHLNGTSTAERVQRREELRRLLDDVGTLPETQRTALLLREIDQLSYEEIAVAMETTIPAVKSLLVRARITLAESSESRALSCDEVRVSLAEAAEGIRKLSGAERIHVRDCEGCSGFRSQLRSDRRALAAVFPFGPLAMLKAGILGKLFGGGAAGGSSTTAVGAFGGSAAGGSAAFTTFGAISGAIGTKAVATAAATALLTAGAVEVSKQRRADPSPAPAIEQADVAPAPAATDDFEERMVSATAELSRPAHASSTPAPAKTTERADDRAQAPAEPAPAEPAPEPEPPAPAPAPVAVEPTESEGAAVIGEPATEESEPGRPEPDTDATVTPPPESPPEGSGEESSPEPIVDGSVSGGHAGALPAAP
jgi:RNA polymerase sigma factor (sigma-70 family)